ncbi:MAG: GNAT family N-acetyltransferase [Candidatus Eremiobacteraeota bacterium]|nr:GNAT family N-acetyltransferase [Candidatus Eremiobacteraeota bacterium]
MAEHSFSVRPATEADLDAVVPLFDAYRRFFTKRPELDVSRAFLQERLQRGESVVIAAFDGSTAAGFLQLYPLFSSWYCQRQWFLSDLYVDEAFRKRGAGAELVRACLAYAEQTQARAVLVELPISEPHLVRFYGALGFQKDELFDLYRAVCR